MSDKSGIKTPLDPTGDFAEIINDTTGLTGITTDNKPDTKPQVVSSSNVSSSSNFRNDTNNGITNGNFSKPGQSESQTTPEEENENDSSYLQNETLNSAYADNVKGEQAVSGTTPDPGSDDDVLSNAHDMGLALEEIEKQPQELNLGADIDKSEEYGKTH